METQGSIATAAGLVGGMSRRTALRRVGGGGLAVGLATALGRDLAAVAQEATPIGEGADDLIGEGLYDQISASMAAKARQAGIDIDVDNMAISAIGENLVVIAPAVRSAPEYPRPGPMALVYFSFSSIACGSLASGYYVLELAQGADLAPLDQVYPGMYEVAVHVVNLNGEIVAERAFTREVMRMRGAEAAAEPPSPPAQVQFQESRLQMGAIDVLVHSSVHYHRACYEIWEWTYGGM